mgnify:CR=1 FL=1
MEPTTDEIAAALDALGFTPEKDSLSFAEFSQAADFLSPVDQADDGF